MTFLLFSKRTCSRNLNITTNKNCYVFGGCRVLTKYLASQRHVDVTFRARDHRAGQWISSLCNEMVVSFVAMRIQGYRGQVIVSHHLKEGRKKIQYNLFQFIPVYTRLTGLHCNIACIRNRGMGTTVTAGVPRTHSGLGLQFWIVPNYFA